ncbi:hypothetical protein [Alkalimarinus coralli]|uniref:hypothetical protein n=1 Tax=Alkalimarinus coralli TaxID=2935863 RepID=UPI00202AC948|nr:hypothetical protein [Alkalimarinus coralli]
MNIKPHHCLTATLVASGMLISWILISQTDNSQPFVSANTYKNDMAAINQKLEELVHAIKHTETQPRNAAPAVSKESQKLRSEPQTEHHESNTLPVVDEPVTVRTEQGVADVVYQLTDDQITEAADSKQNELEQMQNIVWHLERELSRQEDDTSWYPQAEDAIHSALESELFSQSSLANLSCRATMCRIDIAHANQEAETAFLSEINAVAGFADTEAFYTREIDMNGGVLMTYYLSREGHRLPRLAAMN